MTDSQTTILLRRILIGLFLLGSIGMGAELVLLEHWEDPWQWTPVVLLILGVVLGGALAVHRTRWMLRVFQCTMLLFVVSGGVGIYQHLSGNVEFELEMYPSRSGFELVWESLKGATPSLVPGTMTLLGLLGLTYTLRHPLLVKSQHERSSEEGPT